MWSIYTIEYYSDIKQNEISFTAIRMELEAIILREVTQEWKTKHHMFSFICSNKAMRTQRCKNDIVDFGDSGEGWEGVRDKRLHIGYNVHCLGDWCTKTS